MWCVSNPADCVVCHGCFRGAMASGSGVTAEDHSALDADCRAKMACPCPDGAIAEVAKRRVKHGSPRGPSRRRGRSPRTKKVGTLRVCSAPSAFGSGASEWAVRASPARKRRPKASWKYRKWLQVSYPMHTCEAEGGKKKDPHSSRKVEKEGGTAVREVASPNQVVVGARHPPPLRQTGAVRSATLLSSRLFGSWPFRPGPARQRGPSGPWSHANRKRGGAPLW